MKYLRIFIIFIVLIFISNTSYAKDETETINSQKETFGISEFLDESEKYKGDELLDINLEDLLNSALTGKIDNKSIFDSVTGVFFKEVKNSAITIVSILTIILIHSILKAITDNLEDSMISKVIYYAQYILIVTIIMSNFSEILASVKETCINLVSFVNMLVPILISLMMYTGSITTSGLIEPIILCIINFLGNFIQYIIIPITLIIVSLIIISKLSDEIEIEKITKFLKSGTTLILGIILTIFVGVLSIEGTLSSSVDRNNSQNDQSNSEFCYTSCREGFRRCSR